jgi:hypothetical protein
MMNGPKRRVLLDRTGSQPRQGNRGATPVEQPPILLGRI